MTITIDIHKRKTLLITTRQDPNSVSVHTPTETGEALKDLNNDNYDKHNNLQLDMRSYLNDSQIPFIVCLDTLHKMGVVTQPHEHLTSRVKRLYCSNEGKASQDIVSISTGHKEEKQKKGFLNNLFGKKEKQGDKDNVSTKE